MSNSLQRQFYIDDSIQEIIAIVNPQSKEDDVQNIKYTRDIKKEERE